MNKKSIIKHKRNIRCEDIDDAIIQFDIHGYSMETAKPVFFVSTAHDPSVGIYGARISPYFKTQKEAETYLMKMRMRCLGKGD